MPATKMLCSSRAAFKTPEAHADWIERDGIANRLREIAQEISVIYWACADLWETIGDGHELGGLER